MKFRTTIELLTKDIQDIEKLVSNFQNYSAIPVIELDLVLSKLRNAYDVLLMFREDIQEVGNVPKGSEEVSGHYRESPVTPAAHEKSEEDEHPEHSNQAVELQSKAESGKSPDEITEAVEAPARVKKLSHPRKVIREHEKTIGEKLTSDQTFMNEKLGESIRKADISSVLQSSPIKSIASNLGVNDKFYFIRELFNGDSELFKQVIRELDISSNFNSAYNYLLNEFSWDMERDSVQKLLNLVRRKFISPGNE
jgi:hypothetical protein